MLETARVSRATVVNFGHWQSPSTDQPVWGVTGSVSDAVMEMASVVVGVALPNPVGIIRMVEWIGDIRARRPEASIHVVVNKAPGSLSVRKALFEELSSAVGRPGSPFCQRTPGWRRRHGTASWWSVEGSGGVRPVG